MGDGNEQLGVMKTEDAVKKAKSLGLDLVEVAANADPPVCRIVNYGKFMYQQAKKKKESGKKVTTKLKEVKFRVRTEKHDYEMKLTHAEEFLSKGHKLRLQLQFRGREMAHQELGIQLMHRVKEDLAGMGQVDMPPRKAGRNVTMMMSPLPLAQQERKYTRLKEDEYTEEAHGHDDLDDDDDEVRDEEGSSDASDEAKEDASETEAQTAAEGS